MSFHLPIQITIAVHHLQTPSSNTNPIPQLLRIPRPPVPTSSFHEPPKTKNPNPILLAENQKPKCNTQRKNRPCTLNHRAPHQSHTTTPPAAVILVVTIAVVVAAAIIVFDGENPDLVGGESVEREVVDGGSESDGGAVLGVEKDTEARLKAEVFMQTENTRDAFEGGGVAAAEAVESEKDAGAVGGGDKEDDGGGGGWVLLEEEEGGGGGGGGDV